MKRRELGRLKLRQRLEKELGIKMGKTLLLSVGKLNTNKNHVAVVKALVGMLDVIKLHKVYGI